MSQRVVVERLLPIPRLEASEEVRRPAADRLPLRADRRSRPAEIFETCCRGTSQVQVYRALLESNAAFFAAQMTAMDAATRNSAEMIDNLTLYMNKVRQAAITREIIEVVSGAQRRNLRVVEERTEETDGTDSNRQRTNRRARSSRSSARSSTSSSSGHLPEIYNAVRIVSEGRPRRREDRRRRRGRAAPRREPRAHGRDEADRRHAARHDGDRYRRADLGAGRSRRRSAAC